MFTRYPEAGSWHAEQACYLDHKAADVIDTGRQIEGEGVLAICTSCVREMAIEAGMNPDAEGDVESMAAITTKLTEDRDRAVKLTRRLRQQLREERAKFAEAFAGNGPVVDDEE